MMVQQISVFLENKAGRLAEATDVLGKAQVNLRALSIADTKDFGILRLIVSDPAKAVAALEKAGFSVKTNEVIAVSVPDKPGGLHEVLAVFEHLKITIEYLYAFPKISHGSAFVVIRVEDPDKAVKALQAKGVEIVPPDMVYA